MLTITQPGREVPGWNVSKKTDKTVFSSEACLLHKFTGDDTFCQVEFHISYLYLYLLNICHIRPWHIKYIKYMKIYKSSHSSLFISGEQRFPVSRRDAVEITIVRIIQGFSEKTFQFQVWQLGISRLFLKTTKFYLFCFG